VAATDRRPHPGAQAATPSALAEPVT